MKHTRKFTARINETLPKITDRSLRWLAFLNRHGPLTSMTLFEFTRATHRCKDTSLRQLKTLCEQGLLFRPPQQLSFPNAPFNPYVYDLTDKGFLVLKEAGIEKSPTRPTGHFPHLHMVASVSASIEIQAQQAGCEFIEASRILALKNSTLAIPTSQGRLIPDQLFAIKANDGYRAYALEVDRGTEPIVSAKQRKSYRKSIDQYNEVFDAILSSRHYGLTAPLHSLWAFTTNSRRDAFEALVRCSAARFFLIKQCNIDAAYNRNRPLEITESSKLFI